MTDAQTSAALSASSWERMKEQAEIYERALKLQHCAALEELLAAEFYDMHFPGADATVRLQLAEVVVMRTEARLGR